MRLLYATLGVLGGVVGLAFSFLFLQLVMFMGGGQPQRAQLLFIAACVLALASLLGAVAGFMNPRKTAPRWLLMANAGAWLVGALLVAVTGLVAPPDKASALLALKAAATVGLPALLPVAALALAWWKFSPA
ncbi:MAG: hypothetical protein K8F92_07805 [Hyphomicrobium sp.]|uniref:hypothetical protein n=1 Tax=Hyphomicrobium sp. TaxID=82 RepID=UPI0013261D73|nr:hypothetical protein [Hyphomicrobium sp.]KAB2940028.1 MAG: hypothetical protein F9K20_14330 [Hyphomicrobium sp.]MBZ0209543.1 hypothetical protein [Hyphomicrobium sp.]